MSITVATTYTNSTAIQCSTTAATAMGIDALGNPSQTTNIMFVQLFDSVAPTLGTDTPIAVVPIQPILAEGAKTKDHIIFGGGGVRCTTGLFFFVTNAAAANTTAAASTDAPQEVRVFWTPS
jgi:hypothetical protein